MNTENTKMNEASLPEGFDKHPAGEERNYYSRNRGGGPAPDNMTIRPGGRPGGGPGRNMGREIEKAGDAKGTISRLLSYFNQTKKLLVLLILSVISVTLVSLLTPSLQGKAIDYIKEHEWTLLYQSVAFLLIAYLANILFSLAQTLLAARLSQRIVKQMRHDLFRKIDYLSIKYLDTHSSGDIMSRMTNDVENVSNTISQSLGSLVSGVLTIIGTVAIMFLYCWQLTLITLVTILLTVLVTKSMSKAMRKVYRRRSAILGELNGHSEEMITGYKSIVAYNKQDDVIEEFRMVG